jgi:hypothetical protein
MTQRFGDFLTLAELEKSERDYDKNLKELQKIQKRKLAKLLARS